MYSLIMQAETVKELISTNDATVIGVLLAFIAILIYWNLRTDKKLEERNTYIREQDKANLLMMQDLVSSMNTIGQTSQKNATKIESVDSTTSDILTIIKERLTRQK